MIGRVRDEVPDVERIAVLRANALGDFIFVLPALAALKTTYPRAELVLLGAPWHGDLLAGRPGPVDRVLVVPPGKGIREPGPGEPEQSMDEFLVAARRERFDLAIQMHGGGANSNPLVSALGAGLTAGLRAADAPPLDRWLRYVYYQPEVVRYLEVAALVGGQPTHCVPRLAVTDDDRAEALEVAGPSTRPRVALHPGASDPRRRWPVDRFAEVADALSDDGYDVFVTGGGGGERELADQVVSGARSRVRSLAGELSLGGLVGFLASCSVVVSNDTGPVHVAAAVGTPTVGIFWVGNLINCATPVRARHRPVISWRLHCPVCGTDGSRDLYPDRPGTGSCEHRESYVTDVPVVEVLAAVADLAATPRLPPLITAPAC